MFLADRKFLVFVAKFVLLFCLLYFGTSFWIALAAPGGYYSPFVEQHLDFISGIKHSLIWGVKTIFKVLGYETTTEPGFIISVKDKRGIVIAMNCVGYGVYSVWAAYVVANDRNLWKTAGWVIGGLLLLWVINTFRISLFLLAINKGWPMPLGIDHHTWFNIFAYAAIFLMMYFFERRGTVDG
jgi:exosortase/archaeosortase family protein